MNIFAYQQRIIMNNKTILALSVASALLTGCGGGDSQSPKTQPSVSTFKVSGSAFDSDYISNAAVCLDFNILQSCESGFVTKTDANGNFEFDVPESYLNQLSRAVVTVEIEPSSAPTKSEKSPESTTTPSYQTLLALSSDRQSVYISPFTTQVTDKVILKGTRQRQDIEAVVAQVTPEVKEMNKMSAVSDKILFGNYLGTQNNIVTAIVSKAEKSKQWRKRATEIRKKLKSDPAYSEWQTIKPIVWNVYQYAYHTSEYIERYEEYVYLSKLENGKTIERYEGQQWLLDSSGQQDLSSKLQTYQEDKIWTGDTLEIHTTWEFDYNQDGSFDLKGEKLTSGNYQVNEQGELSISQLELYNEGNPSAEGGAFQKREYCNNLDLSTELAKYKKGEDLDTCVDMVQIREFGNHKDKVKGFVSTDAMSEYKKPNDDITQPINTDYVAYFENREFYWTLDGGQGTNIYKDWDAKSKSSFKLDRSPFNYLNENYVGAEGNLHRLVSVPFWPGASQNSDVKASTIQLLGQWNPVSWGKNAPGFASEKFDESGSSETYDIVISPTDHSHQWDNNRQDNVTLNLPFLDEKNQPVPVVTVKQTWDKSRKVMTAETKFFPITPDTNHALTADLGPKTTVSVDTSVQYSGKVQGLDTAEQTVQVDEQAHLSSKPAFSKSYFNETVKWTVTSSNLPSELMSLLFNNGNNFTFSESTVADYTALNKSFCGGKNINSVAMDLTHNIGGDIVSTAFCGDGSVDSQFGASKSMPGQYLLRMTDQLNTDGIFKADLLMWKQGENIYTDTPDAYQLEFTLTK